MKMLAAHQISRPGLAAVAGAALAIAAFAGPSVARDLVHTCVANPGNEETATVVFHPKLFGVDGHEGDGDVFNDDYEHRFHYEITVTDHDPAKPGWTGPTRCSVGAGWARDWDIPNIRPEFVTQNPGAIIYLKNVPRHSKVQLHLWVDEDDDGQNDRLDFDPSPNGADVYLNVFVNQKAAQTMVGAREGRNDVTLNEAKRLVGDGQIGWNQDHVRAFVEFVTNVHPDKKWLSDPLMGKLKPKQIPGSALQPKAKPTPDQRPECRDYALKSVQQNQQQLALGCGFAPPVWSNDHQMHFDWCVQGNNAALIQTETQKRDTQLAGCKQAQATQTQAAACQQYAGNATAIVTQAIQFKCPGLVGPKWANNYNAHYNWCMTGIPKNVLRNENQARMAALAACTTDTKK